MRVLVPTVDYPPIEGGIGTVALHVSRELAALGHDVTVVAPRFPDMDAFDAAEPVRVLRFPGYGLGWARFVPLLRAAWPLVEGADLVLGINVAYGGVLGRLARARRGTPYVAFAYAYEFLKFGRPGPARALLRSVYRNAAVTVAISRYTARALADFGAPRDRIATILPGAPEARACTAAEVAAVRDRLGLGTDRYVLAVGRFVARKGHERLVRAMPRILEACPNTRLVLVGRGPCEGACREKARSLGIEGLVHFAGRVDDATLAVLYQDCALFALPTGTDANGQVEGFGLVFTEAHAYGKAVVAGHSGGVADAVRHGETGLLVAGEDVDAVAGAVIGMLRDEGLARRLGEAGKRRVAEELNWRVFTERVVARAGVEA